VIVATALWLALGTASPMPGLYAPPSAAGVLAVEALDARSQPAARAILRQLAAGRWPRGVASTDDPGAADCSAKPYAAAARIGSRLDSVSSGWFYDIGLTLVDCGGWNVDEWHETLTQAQPPDEAEVERLGMSLLLRLRTWIHEQPARAHRLFDTGLARDSDAAGPTYLYALFKTNDGYMRAYVRPGGPAYAAGMRTNDVVDKIDGRYWWEYGTYQSQLKAYDGKPHTFDLTRGPAKLHVALGTPLQ